MLVDMMNDSKEFFLNDRRLTELVFRFYVLLVILTAVLSYSVTRRAIAVPDFFQVMGIQIVMAGFLFYKFLRGDWKPLLGISWRTLRMTVLLLSGYFLFLFSLDCALALISGTPGILSNASGSLIHTLSLVVVSPIVEELFFRDLFFRTQHFESKYSWWSAAFFSSFAFMIAHLSLYPGAFLLGFCSCFLIRQSRSILPSIVFHSVSNASLYFIPKLFPALAAFLKSDWLAGFFYR